MGEHEAGQAASARLRVGVGAAIVLLLVGMGVTVAIGAWRATATPAETIAETPLTFATPAPDPLGDDEVYVHVSGAVMEPGLYVLAEGDRVVDAIAAAGGLAEVAAHAGVNLARVLVDGELLHVPAEGEQLPPAEAVSGDAAGSRAAIDLNSADAGALETLPGVGPALAERIIAWRTAEGRFESVDDLLMVSGIGPKVLEGLRERARV
ncbi:helix-hairpin-helix domain-containing protein [Microbacterium amylolyticum]|uniref:Competence protein ComEA n=1 Tax=Microbacterium amylolyticum TaxID=936337 RepID=A0ABS4ZGQ7_9MICO|nr:helix-hairpin-helix domain-containing protein [Microbacterium amylolyticum]MBP2435661.1 competence protein ComEA [Microbacterium amylolyticum]